MPDHSSISNSEPAKSAGTIRGIRRWRARINRLPYGAVWAVVLVLLVHLAGMVWVSRPIASTDLRRRVNALTARAKPSLILAGDSRAHCGLMPAVVADELHLPRPLVINIADEGSDSSAMWCAYREFAPRFAPRPIVLLDVSAFSVNDGAAQLVSDELLWELSFRERCRIVPTGRAIAACFLAEKAIWGACLSSNPSDDAVLADGGYGSRTQKADMTRWSIQQRRRSAAAVKRLWYDRPCVNGVRWAKFERDARTFAQADVQLILLIPPSHPEFSQFGDLATEEIDRQIHDQLAELGRRLGLPVMTCPSDWSGNAKPDSLFCDFLHLNRAGAEVYSRWAARQLRELADAGVVRFDPHPVQDPQSALASR